MVSDRVLKIPETRVFREIVRNLAAVSVALEVRRGPNPLCDPDFVSPNTRAVVFWMPLRLKQLNRPLSEWEGLFIQPQLRIGSSRNIPVASASAWDARSLAREPLAILAATASTRSTTRIEAPLDRSVGEASFGRAPTMPRRNSATLFGREPIALRHAASEPVRT